MLISRDVISCSDEMRNTGAPHHGKGVGTIELPDITGGWPATARGKAHQFHAQLVEIAVAACIFALDADPELVEWHRFFDHHAGDLDVVAGFDLLDEFYPPLGPIVAEMYLKGPRSERRHGGVREEEIVVDDREPLGKMRGDILEFHGIGSRRRPLETDDVGYSGKPRYHSEGQVGRRPKRM